MNKDNWYQTFFNGLALDLWQQAVTPEQTREEIRFVHSVTTIDGHAKVLDAPCGFGRHALALAHEGHHVTAIDISADYIRRVEETARMQQLHLSTVCADVLEYNITEWFDCAICMGNSFSYFSYDKMKSFVGKVSACLKSGGSFIINTAMLAESALPLFKEKSWMEIGDLLFLNEMIYHTDDSILQVNYRFIKEGMMEKKTAFYFIFTLAEIKRLLQACGFSHIQVYGGVDKSSYKPGSRQAWIVAIK